MSIEFNDLLKRLMEYAKTVGNTPAKGITAARFILAVLDTIDGVSGIEMNQEQREKMVNCVISKMEKAEYSPAEFRTAITAHLKTPSDYHEELKLAVAIVNAKSTVKADGSEEITPEDLLTQVFEEPDDFINSVLNHTPFQDSKEQTKETPPEQPMARAGAPVDKHLPKKALTELTEKVKRIYRNLDSIVFGQENALSIFAAGYFRSELIAMTSKDNSHPRATFLFAGPPGVGKTYLAENVAKELNLPVRCFDMSEYVDKEANIEFAGSDKVYKDGAPGNVTSYVEKHPRSVVIFDEIEKAHLNVIHLFLQILDSGRLRDNYTDREVSFADTILIFTTNAGRPLYEGTDATDFSNVPRKVIINAIRKDINPVTQEPYFPDAICSRFASGNVVMFNHITAHNLCKISEDEFSRHAETFRDTMNIEIEIDSRLYAALMFAEGGTADARTVKHRTSTFFNEELFELFRLLSIGEGGPSVENLQIVKISLELEGAPESVSKLFRQTNNHEVLVFASQEKCEECARSVPEMVFHSAQTLESAAKLLKEKDISFVLTDMTYGVKKSSGYLNLEDVDSEARDVFRHIRESYESLPIYLLEGENNKLSEEELVSFRRQGVRGTITLDGTDSFVRAMQETAEQMHLQSSMDLLAKSSKIVSFETAQTVNNNGTVAEIKLFDFSLIAAVDSEDAENVVSSISKPDTKFEDIIGAEDAQKELRYFVDYLKNPKKYMGTGLSSPKGVILYGPPGTGKTMLAKAMANESDVTFIAAEGNQFINGSPAEGKETVHKLFRMARKYAPSILFIDEIDAIAKERGGYSLNDITLTAFLTEMDGFKSNSSKPVFVLAATNFDVTPGSPKSLDPALMRRFDRRIFIDLPNRNERVKYMKMRFAMNPAFCISDEKTDNIAVRSTGMSLADLASVLELSLRTAVRNGSVKVTDEIFDEAFEVFNGGEEKHWDSAQLERVARHESGHAFLYWKNGETPSYVTIVARGGHGGYMQHGDHEGKGIYTKEELLSRIRTSLAGRAAEIVYYGDEDGITTGASSDLHHATATAQYLVCSCGMDRDFGLSVVGDETIASSDKVRERVNAILEKEMQNTVDIIRENKMAIDALTERLLAENHLSGDEIAAVFEKAYQ